MHGPVSSSALSSSSLTEFPKFRHLVLIASVVPQALTKDSVTVTVDAVVYYRIQDPLNAVVKVTNYR